MYYSHYHSFIYDYESIKAYSWLAPHVYLCVWLLHPVIGSCILLLRLVLFFGRIGIAD